MMLSVLLHLLTLSPALWLHPKALCHDLLKLQAHILWVEIHQKREYAPLSKGHGKI